MFFFLESVQVKAIFTWTLSKGKTKYLILSSQFYAEPTPLAVGRRWGAAGRLRGPGQHPALIALFFNVSVNPPGVRTLGPLSGRKPKRFKNALVAFFSILDIVGSPAPLPTPRLKKKPVSESRDPGVPWTIHPTANPSVLFYTRGCRSRGGSQVFVVGK